MKIYYITPKIAYIMFILFLGLIMISCTDNPASNIDGPGEEELITQVTLTLVDGNSSETTVSWQDQDGPGGNDPVVGTLQLQAGTTYTGTIELLDTTKDPVEDITQEVREEDDEHQFFYTVGDSISDRLDIEVTDTDENGLPVGLEYSVTVSAGDAASGSLNVVLSHYDDAPKDGTTRSDETDIDIDIPVEIQM